MMPYKGFYWHFFAPMMKHSIAKRFSPELAERRIRKGKAAYRGLLTRADDIGKGNSMAMNACFAYVFVAAWLGGDKAISPDGMAEVMGDVLRNLQFFSP